MSRKNKFMLGFFINIAIFLVVYSILNLMFGEGKTPLSSIYIMALALSLAEEFERLGK